ncbi:GNAT family N-acetyltransferase [Pukyongiella litopenaei]|uniref:GNAT family N-acetyltransferase n=1 Tax=Pukyongiella litopenaei TaxID=2605946 RepID=A0A2S0MSM1_9RHOB|nr:GNAT family N-acetyltransferase [Pukyongiella litopenaei]AVO38889.1 GNAT family N-acetyltransferase [Pukyongiella litopenaei]
MTTLSDGFLGDGFHDIPAGRLTAIVTHLEMREAAAPRPVPAPENATLLRVERPETGWYRDLFTRIGALDWLWYSRLSLDDAALAAILHDPAVEVYALDRDGQAIGLLELDFRQPGACELAFFGLTPEAIGGGAGRYLMNRAIDLAWARPIRLFHVHTCTLDHPGALGFYIRSGFTPVRQQIEVAPDPRLSGLLPETAGPHVPLFR